MKILFGCVAVFTITLAFSIIGNAQKSNNFVAKFNPSGDYHPLNSPTITSEKFIQFDLQVRQRKGKLVAWGEIRGVEQWYKITFISVTEKVLKFSTVKINGVNYEFEGEFLGKGDFTKQFSGTGVAMLKGTLRKLVNNKKSVEINTSFLYYPGC